MHSTPISLLYRVRDPADRTAWSEFDALYRPLLGRFCEGRGLCGADADDIVQDCMAAIHKHIGGFEYDRSKGTFKGWLRTLVNNRIRNLYRRRREVSTDHRELDQTASPDARPDELFERLWLDQHVRRSLSILRMEVPYEDFLAFTRYGLDGASAAEVGEMMGKTPNQLYKIKFRLSRRLRQIISDVCDGME